MSKVTQYDGVLYSLSNRRLFVFRVVANLTKGGIKCKVHLYSGDHPRVQEQRYDHRLGREATKWERAFSTKCEGKWVHVFSKYRWRQERSPAYIGDVGEDVAVGKEGATAEEEVQVGWMGAEAEPLVFMGQPQLEPDAEKTDVPLSVWTTEDRVSAVGPLEGSWVCVGEEEAELHGVKGFLGCTEYYEISSEPATPSTADSDHEWYSEHEPDTPSTADNDHHPATPSIADSDQDMVSVDGAEAVEKDAGAGRRNRWNKMPSGNCDHDWRNVGTVKEGAAGEGTFLW